METDVVLPVAEILERKDAKQVALILFVDVSLSQKQFCFFLWRIFCEILPVSTFCSVSERKRAKRAKRKTKSAVTLPVQIRPKAIQLLQAIPPPRKRGRKRSRSSVMPRPLLLNRQVLSPQSQRVNFRSKRSRFGFRVMGFMFVPTITRLLPRSIHLALFSVLKLLLSGFRQPHLPHS